MASPEPKSHDVFQAIADPTRRQMLRLLSQDEMPVNVITGHFPMTRTAVSKHLRILSEAGLVTEKKVGRETRYRLQPEPLKALKDWLLFYEQLWNDRFDRLEDYLAAEMAQNDHNK